MVAALNATLTALGALSIRLNDQQWLSSGAVAIRNEGQWYSSDCSTLQARECKPLTPSSRLTSSSGTDSVGDFTEESLAWSTSKDSKPVFLTGVRSYAVMDDVKVLTQSFPEGLKPRNVHGLTDEIVTAFPTLGQNHLDLGVLFYEGVQLQNSHFFRWRKGSPWGSSEFKPGKGVLTKFDDDGSGMPLLLTAADGGTMLVSPLVDFFTSAQTSSKAMGNFSIGMQGTVEAVPEDHVHQTLLVGGSGVRSATMRWGQLMMKAAGGGKTRSMNWTQHGDVSLRSLSYYTDNGAYYYYQTVNGTGSCSPPNAPCPKIIADMPQDATGYQKTMKQLLEYFGKIALPVSSIQYDSWWYYKGNKQGIKLWEPMPSTLGGPAVNGDPSTWLALPNISTVTHSRWYQNDNEYIAGTAPGLPSDWQNWSWYIDSASGVGVSTDTRFFEHIMTRAKAGLTMATYEQDFLAKQYESCAALQREVGAGREWLAAMAAAAESVNVTVQYCMALPRHILQSAAFPRVTHARASHDYGQSRSDDTEQWSSIGLTSILYWSIGLLPLKDDFWSEINEDGNHWQAVEADPELQTLVSSIIAGPVAPAGAIGSMNRTRLMRTCRQDGILLKPHSPAMNLDSTFVAALMGTQAGGAGSFVGVPSVWGTTMSANFDTDASCAVSGVVAPPIHHLLLFANVSSSGYSVTASELQRIDAETRQSPDFAAQFDNVNTEAEASASVTASPSSFVAREFYSGALRVVDAKTPLHVAHAAKPASCAHLGVDADMYCIPFELWALAPVPVSNANAGGWLLLGEADKYVAVSGQRFQALTTSTTAALSATVLGAPNEVVHVALLDCRGTGSCVDSTMLKEVKVDCALGTSGSATLKCDSACSCTS